MRMAKWIIGIILFIMLGVSFQASALPEKSICNSTFFIEEIFEAPNLHPWEKQPGEIVKISDRVSYIEYIPATYDTVIDKNIVHHASTELITLPAEWGWVEGEHPGFSSDILITPPVYETVKEVVVIREETKHFVLLAPEYKLHEGKKYMVKGPEFVETVIPAVTKEVSRKRLAKPKTVKTVELKNIIRNGQTYKVTLPPRTIEGDDSPRIYYSLRRVVKTPARSVEKILEEPLYKWVPENTQPVIDKILLRNEKGEILRVFESRSELEAFKSDLTCVEMIEHFSELVE